MEIYQPSEDSYLLSETLGNYLKGIKNKKIKILDMASGSGIQALTCRKLGFNNVIAVDINPEAVKHLKKQGFKSILSDLFLNIYKRKGDLRKFDFANKLNNKIKLELGEPLVPIRFSLIIFNPPYLPEDKYDKNPDTTAGKKGYELIIRFLRQAKSYLDKNGVILLLFSSLSRPSIIKKQAKKSGYNLELLSRKNLFFEELYVYLLS